MNAKTATKAYAAVAIESGVHAADPHKLIAMLYQGAMLAIANAKNGILRKDIQAKNASITQAIQIISEGLQASLDKNVGGELAQNLDALYGYMCTRLLSANLENSVEKLDEVARLLGELKSAWDAIRSTVVPATGAVGATSTTPQPVPAPNKQAALVYGRM